MYLGSFQAGAVNGVKTTGKQQKRLFISGRGSLADHGDDLPCSSSKKKGGRDRIFFLRVYTKNSYICGGIYRTRLC